MRRLAVKSDDTELAQPDPAPAPADAAHAKRLAAIMSVHGMWRGDPDKPQDGVAYQREVRAEWR